MLTRGGGRKRRALRAGFRSFKYQRTDKRLIESSKYKHSLTSGWLKEFVKLPPLDKCFRNSWLDRLLCLRPKTNKHLCKWSIKGTPKKKKKEEKQVRISTLCFGLNRRLFSSSFTPPAFFEGK